MEISVFNGKQIRKTIYNNEWWFSVVDVIAVLTDSSNPNDYWYRMKVRIVDDEGIQLSTFCRSLKLLSSDGKKYETDCANTESMFRIIQSIPSPKAEPFKRWLAKVGYERVQEIEDPELATKRTRALYKLKGYSDDWIEKRMRGISIREELTDEWHSRGAKENWGSERQQKFIVQKTPKECLSCAVMPKRAVTSPGEPARNLRKGWGDQLLPRITFFQNV